MNKGKKLLAFTRHYNRSNDSINNQKLIVPNVETCDNWFPSWRKWYRLGVARFIDASIYRDTFPAIRIAILFFTITIFFFGQ